MATRNIVPNANSEGGLGTPSKHWRSVYTDYLNGKETDSLTDKAYVDSLFNSIDLSNYITNDALIAKLTDFVEIDDLPFSSVSHSKTSNKLVDEIGTDIAVGDENTPVYFINGTPKECNFSIPNNAQSHNAIYRGKDITDDYDSGRLSTNIANGTFDNIFIGDYIIKSPTLAGGHPLTGTRWIVADINYFKGEHENALADNHIVLVPDRTLFHTSLNGELSTDGGYKNLDIFKERLSSLDVSLLSTFASHIIAHNSTVTTSINSDGRASSNEVVQIKGCDLMTEQMVNGSSTIGNHYDMGMQNKQLSLFKFSNDIYTEDTYWLKDIENQSKCAVVSNKGYISTDEVTTSLSIRPYIVIK